MPLEAETTNRTFYCSPTFLKELTTLLTQTDKRTIGNYLHWKLIESLADLVLDRKLSAYLDNDTGHWPRWKYCLKIVCDQLPASVAAVFVRRYSNATTKLAAEKIAENVRRQIALQFSNSSSLKKHERSKVLKRLQNIRILIGASEELQNITQLNEHYELLNDLSGETFFESMLSIRVFNEKRLFHQVQLHLQRDPTIWARDLRFFLYIESLYEQSVNRICKISIF